MQLQIKMKYSIPFVKHAALCKSLLFYFVSSSMWQDFITLPFLHLYHFLNCFSFITTKSQNKIATSIFEIGWWIHEWKRREHIYTSGGKTHQIPIVIIIGGTTRDWRYERGRWLRSHCDKHGGGGEQRTDGGRVDTEELRSEGCAEVCCKILIQT